MLTSFYPRITKNRLNLGVCLAGLLLLTTGGAQAAEKPRPDLLFKSFTASHSELAPGSELVLSFSITSQLQDAKPFEIGLYYAFGANAPAQGARQLAIEVARKGVLKDGVVTFNVPVMVPQCEKCGPLKLTAYIDPLDRLDEVREDNNRAVTVVNLEHSFVPDLRVQSVKVTPYGGAHTNRVSVDALIENRSRVHAQGPFRLSVYCSVDRQITPLDVRLYSVRQESLAPMHLAHLARDVSLVPACNIRGMTTWVGVIADDLGDVYESNEQNNTNSFGYWVVRAADLVSGKLLLSTGSGPAQGQVGVNFKVSNQGRDRASSFKIGLYLSNDATITATDTLLDTVSLPSLAANTESGTLQSVVVIPKGIRGQYYLGALVDVDGKVGELRERNNFRTEPFLVNDVDLTDQYFLADQHEVSAGAEMKVELALRNRGQDAAQASRVGVYYSDDPHFDRGVDLALGSVEIEALVPGKRAERSLEVKVPPIAREGYRFLLMVSDDNDSVSESDELNNVALRPIHVIERP